MANADEKLADRYMVAEDSEGGLYILTRTSARIVEYVTHHPLRTYSEVSSELEIPVSSLMVYAMRLDNAGILQRYPLIDSDGRQYVGLCMRRGLEIKQNVTRI